VLLEDQAGMVNVIVRPQVYDAYRVSVRGEPFLWVRGTLAKDDGTVNVLAEEIRGLGPAPRTETPPDARAWAFLKTLRRVAPDSKDWG
jgi:hypothetical protein